MTLGDRSLYVFANNSRTVIVGALCSSISDEQRIWNIEIGLWDYLKRQPSDWLKYAPAIGTNYIAENWIWII